MEGVMETTQESEKFAAAGCWHSLLSLGLGLLPTLERRERERPIQSLLTDNPYGVLVKGETRSSGKARA